MAKIVNSKSEIILDDPDEFPEGALLTYLDRKEIDYNLYTVLGCLNKIYK